MTSTSRGCDRSRKRGAVVLCLLLTSCKPSILSVDDVLHSYDRLDGQVIQVQGLLVGCQPYSCYLSADEEGDRAYLMIGESEQFDRSVTRSHGHRIIVEGRLNAACIRARLNPSKRGQALICIDRVDELSNPKLVLDQAAS